MSALLLDPEQGSVTAKCSRFDLSQFPSDIHKGNPKARSAEDKTSPGCYVPSFPVKYFTAYGSACLKKSSQFSHKTIPPLHHPISFQVPLDRPDPRPMLRHPRGPDYTLLLFVFEGFNSKGKGFSSSQQQLGALQGRRIGKVMGRTKKNSMGRIYITKSRVSSGNSSSVRRQTGRKQCPASKYIYLSLSSWLASCSCLEFSSQPCVLVSISPLEWPFKIDCSH